MNFLYGDTTRFYIKTASTHSLTESIRASTIRLRVLARYTVQGAVATWRYETREAPGRYRSLYRISAPDKQWESANQQTKKRTAKRRPEFFVIPTQKMNFIWASR